MLIASVIIVLGFLGLIWGADKFVSGASGLARNLGVSPLLIGLTIVAFGTSAPEIFSSAVAAMQKKPELAIGNAFGSNLFNVGIALGIAALIKPLKAPESMLNRELPALLLVTVITGILIADLQLDLLDAILLIMITVFFIYRLLKQQIKSTKASLETPEQESTRMKSLKAVAYLTIGLLILVISAEALVQAASNIAEALGVSASIIGLTIVALGTSLPELAASVTCVLKNQDELAIGNIVGSNILNLLAVLPFPGIFAPGLIEANLFYRDFSIVTFLTILLCFFFFFFFKKEIHI